MAEPTMLNKRYLQGASDRVRTGIAHRAIPAHARRSAARRFIEVLVTCAPFRVRQQLPLAARQLADIQRAAACADFFALLGPSERPLAEMRSPRVSRRRRLLLAKYELNQHLMARHFLV